MLDNKSNSIDRKIGSQIRLRREEISMSDSQLAERIGLDVKQLKDFESGLSRISPGCLQRISEILDVPVMFFFRMPEDDCLSNPKGRSHHRLTADHRAVFENALQRTEDRKLRAKILTLVKALQLGKITPDKEG